MTEREVLGWRNRRGLNDSFFVTIYPLKTSSFPLSDEMLKYCVVGRKKGSSENVSTTWETPLQGNGLESMLNSTLLTNAQSGAIDSLTDTDYLKGKTLVTRKETLSIFTQAQPIEKDFTLEFVAQKDAMIEVEAPYRFLQKLASPQLVDGFLERLKGGLETLNEGSLRKIANDRELIGETPLNVAIMIGNQRILHGELRVQSVSSSEDELSLTTAGVVAYREVQITLNSDKAINRDQIKIF